MSIELTTRSIGMSENFYDNYVEQAVDCDITLPDYCPDIMRIIRCTVSVGVTNSKLIGDRATADGDAKIHIVYADEKNKVFCYDYDYPFSRYAELNGAFDGAVLLCNAKCEFVNYRAVSKRRIDVHGAVSVRFRVCGNKNDTLISDAVGDGIQLKKRGLDIADNVAVASKGFVISQVENVGEMNGGIGKILDSFASPILSECKIIKGKLLLKGELAVRVIYCSDNGNNESCTLSCSIPFNEIAEVPAVEDGCCVDVKMTVDCLSAEPKTDNDGEYRYMNINADVTALINVFSEKSIKAITDAYSTKTQINAKYSPMEFRRVNRKVNEAVMCERKLDLSSMNPEKIYAFTISRPVSRCTFKDNKMTVSGKVPVSIIVIDSEGVPSLCEREAEFQFVQSVENAQQLVAEPDVSVGGCSCSLTGDAKADFRAEVFVRATVFENVRENVMTSLEAVEGTQKANKKTGVVIYFCSGNESVWDIARKYNTTVEEIMEENELSADYLENKTMLLIPVK